MAAQEQSDESMAGKRKRSSARWLSFLRPWKSPGCTVGSLLPLLELPRASLESVRGLDVPESLFIAVAVNCLRTHIVQDPGEVLGA
jgi:hypothetical protein